MAKSGRKLNIKILIVTILNLLAIISVIWSLKTLFNLKENALAVKKELVAAEANVASIKSLENLLAGLKKENEKMSYIFLEKEEIVSFIETLEKLAGISGVKLEIKSIKITDDLSGNKKSEKPVLLLETSGSFRDIFYFISLAQKLPYQISFNQVDIHKNALNKNEKNLWNSKISVTVLSYQNENE
jgi:Tfp pilus assembly protein PilO